MPWWMKMQEEGLTNCIGHFSMPWRFIQIRDNLRGERKKDISFIEFHLQEGEKQIKVDKHFLCRQALEWSAIKWWNLDIF